MVEKSVSRERRALCGCLRCGFVLQYQSHVLAELVVWHQNARLRMPFGALVGIGRSRRARSQSACSARASACSAQGRSQAAVRTPVPAPATQQHTPHK
eukprot:9659345-Alexandrium_andersonii.AAC.1